ncbi:sensor histidine kinase [Nocardioides litoris]|uniref:sensor histidine kinase n=1 Tax=Nocardioides litoris TaxID=1926648 RepID=UPI0011229048|nr:histidine kinase [Nocardioides litoris]
MTEERALRWAGPPAVALFLAAGVAGSTRPLAHAVVVALVGVAGAVAAATLAVTGPRAGLVLAVPLVATYAVCAGSSSNLGWFGVCIVVGWVAIVARPRVVAAVAVPAVAAIAAQWLVDADEPGWGAWVAGTVFTAVACSMAHRQRELLAALQEAQTGLAERAAAEERNRIAHELHDVIGHALTVSLLHVTSARLALDEDPAEAAASLEEAERLSQQSLAEVRAVVGLMRDAGAVAPLPGAGQLDDLVASFDRAGTPVTWSVDGDPASLTATEALTVYRILQESLTNAARHAPGAATTARVEVGAAGTTVVVDSAGPAPAVVHEGGGLVGMRQRAAAVGGRLTAGPHAGGWRVEAVLPS